jgi:hypothetical protein
MLSRCSPQLGYGGRHECERSLGIKVDAPDGCFQVRAWFEGAGAMFTNKVVLLSVALLWSCILRIDRMGLRRSLVATGMRIEDLPEKRVAGVE